MHIYTHNRRTRHRQETQAQESPPRQGALAPRRLIGPVLLNDGCGRRGERRASGSVGRAGSSNVWSVRARTGLRLPVEGEDGDRPLVHLAHAKARVVRLDAAVGSALVVVVGADLGASGEGRGTARRRRRGGGGWAGGEVRTARLSAMSVWPAKYLKRNPPQTAEARPITAKSG